MQAGRNPIRRNRNIGTPKQGYGRDNRLVIPERRYGPTFLGDVGRHRVVVRKIGSKDLRFLVEETRDDCVHACTVDDIAHVLAQLPGDDWEGLDLIYLRQPTRKQEVLSLVWGRLAYYTEIADLKGAALILEAIDTSKPRKWPLSLDPEAAVELERLREAGHRIETTRRAHIVRSSLGTGRATQLYHTVLHETGHWVDYLRSVEKPAAQSEDQGDDWSHRWDLYWSRPPKEREAFAHRYADEVKRKLSNAGVIPFERRLDLDALRRDGLRPEDFIESRSER